MQAELLAICTGKVQPLIMRDPHDERVLMQEMSAIVKSPIQQGSDQTAPGIACHALGIEGDEQADLSVHGGIDQAIYCYPSEHYRAWKEHLPWLTAIETTPFGLVGENLCTHGISERDTFVGDQIQIGETCRLIVTRPRIPCGKFNARMKSNQAVKIMVQEGLCGWYCRVLTPGRIKTGDPFTVIPGSRETTISASFQALGRKALL